MPTYEYQCQVCEHTFERYQSITAAPVRTCPECGRRKVRRLIGTGAALLFKGNGFYQTDYRSKSYEQAAKAETKDSSKQDKSDSSGKKTSTTTDSGGSDSAGGPSEGGKQP